MRPSSPSAGAIRSTCYSLGLCPGFRGGGSSSSALAPDFHLHRQAEQTPRVIARRIPLLPQVLCSTHSPHIPPASLSHHEGKHTGRLLICRREKETSGRGDESGRWRMAGKTPPRSDTRSDRDRVTAEDLGQVSALTGRGCGYSTLHDRVHQARHFFSQFLIV